MFRILGTTICRTWFVWILGWLVLFGALYATAPPWNKVAQDREFGFLPEDAPTRQAETLLKQAFPEDKQASNIVIIVTRPDAELDDKDRAFVKNVVKPAILKIAAEEGGMADASGGTGESARNGTKSIIAKVRTFDDPGSGILLVSADRQSMLIVIELTTELLKTSNWPTIEKVQDLMAQWKSQGQIPAGLNLYLNGSATVGRDMILGQSQSAHSTELWTIVFVIVILLLIYRAPFLAMIPLISVFMATQISLALLSHLAQAGYVTVFDGIEIYITVILYGTGVDYCLFLIARHQEERERGADWGDALANAIARTGPALAASAVTVMLGIGMMVFAKFGKFHYAGIAVAISLAVSLCVVLTFTTSLLRLAGRWAFWPKKIASAGAAPAAAANDQQPGMMDWLSWHSFGGLLLRWPGLIWLFTVLLMTPLALGGILYGDKVDYDFVRRLPPSAPSVAGDKAMQEHFPSGTAGVITVLIYDPQLDFLVHDGKGQIDVSALTDRIWRQRTPLQLADIRSWSRPVGTGWAAREAVGAPVDQIERGLKQALKYYVCSQGELKGHVTRIELTMLQNPLSLQGIDTLDRIEETVRSELLHSDLREAKAYFLGVTAQMKDLRTVTSSDQIRMQLLVVACVLVVLFLLLRRPVVSLYLIASVLFSYFTSLGIAYCFFWWLDPDHFQGLDWKVPIFLFTILVAIGEDYNIFLMTRVSEEQEQHGMVEGIRVALSRTGSIITSCGIIMAGTFASLMTGTMQDLQHLGFALAVGVALDTFVVRSILVPTFLIMVERGNLLWQKLSPGLDAAQEPRKEVSHPS